MTTPTPTTPRFCFSAAGSAAMASTFPGGCPYEATVPRWAKAKEETVIGPSEVRPNVILVVGGPGSGRSTVCNRVAKEFKYVHLSVDELLREECARPDSDLRDVADEHVTVEVILRAIQQQDDWKHRKFLVSGFPKNLAELEAFNKIMGNKVRMKACLALDCSEANMEQRLLENADAVQSDIVNRIANFSKDAISVQRHFQYEGRLERIDANREMVKVWNDVQQYFVLQAHEQDFDHSSCSPSKAIWKLRDKQKQELYPTGSSHTSTNYVKGEDARNFSSYLILAKHRDKHTRNMRSPVDNFLEPMTMAHEIGWHQADDGEHIGAKGTPRGMTTPRSFYPRNTCSMTRHMENMYSTNAQHIIRRW